MIKDHSKNYNTLAKLMDKLKTTIPETMKALKVLPKTSPANGVLLKKADKYFRD